MISAEAPILFAKGCDIFITELTMRAWIHAEENKRRTLQRSDIASALAKSDMFDFLIDIVPREDATPQHKRRPEYAPQGTYTLPDPAQGGATGAGMPPEQAQMGGPQDFGSVEQQHMAPQQYQQQMSSYPPPQAPQQYGGQQMFDPNNMYGGQPPGYPMGQMQGMPQQTVSPTLWQQRLISDGLHRCINLLNLRSTHRWRRHIVLNSRVVWMIKTPTMSRTSGLMAKKLLSHFLSDNVALKRQQHALPRQDMRRVVKRTKMRKKSAVVAREKCSQAGITGVDSLKVSYARN